MKWENALWRWISKISVRVIAGLECVDKTQDVTYTRAFRLLV